MISVIVVKGDMLNVWTQWREGRGIRREKNWKGWSAPALSPCKARSYPYSNFLKRSEIFWRSVKLWWLKISEENRKISLIHYLIKNLIKSAADGPGKWQWISKCQVVLTWNVNFQSVLDDDFVAILYMKAEAGLRVDRSRQTVRTVCTASTSKYLWTREACSSCREPYRTIGRYLFKPKFHYADFTTFIETFPRGKSQTKIMKVHDTDYVADFRGLCCWLFPCIVTD